MLSFFVVGNVLLLSCFFDLVVELFAEWIVAGRGVSKGTPGKRLKPTIH